MMLGSWFGSKSSRHPHSRYTSPSPQPAPENAKSGPSDAWSVSQSLQAPGNPSSLSDIPLDEVHAHINDPPTPSLIHSVEKDTGTLITPEAPTVSMEAPLRDRDRVSLLEHTPFTPQDAILAEVFRKVPATDRTRGVTPPPVAQPSVSMTSRTSDSPPPPPSTQTAPAPTVQMGSRVTIYDPSSGTRLGQHSSMAAVTDVDPLNARLPAAGDDHRLWSSLGRILELQAEIAAMHAEMEGVGKGAGMDAGSGHAGPGGVAIVQPGVGEGRGVGPTKRSRRGQTLPIGDEEPEEHSAGLAMSEISVEHSDGEDDDDDDNDVRGFGKRRRDGEFARLAEQFTQRKTAIGGILNKLDDLSMALKTFHTLPPPLFDLAVPPSRSDTLSSSPSNTSAPPSSPPNLHPRRSSSPLSSISPLHIGNPVTPPMVPLSLPVPPMSTLASSTYESVSSDDVKAPLKRFGDVVSPVLPQTIIPGAPRVESPVDSIPTRSVFFSTP